MTPSPFHLSRLTLYPRPVTKSKRSSNQAAGEAEPEAYPQGYVKDFDIQRTKLVAVFSIRLILPDFRFGVHLLVGKFRLRVPFVVH